MMYCKCDGCGKEAEAVYVREREHYLKPAGWFEKPFMRMIEWADPPVLQVCSLACVPKAEENVPAIRAANQAIRKLAEDLEATKKGKKWKDHLNDETLPDE